MITSDAKRSSRRSLISTLKRPLFTPRSMSTRANAETCRT